MKPTDPTQPPAASHGRAGATLTIRLSARTAELLADVALARSVTHQGETTMSGVIEDLVERARGQLEEEAETVRSKRARGHD